VLLYLISPSLTGVHCVQTKKANKKKQSKEPQVQEAQVLDDDSSIRSHLSFRPLGKLTQLNSTNFWLT
jgi:hypothetical protein